MPIAIGAGALGFLGILAFILLGVALAYFIVPPLVQLLRQVPIVGGGIADNVQGAINLAVARGNEFWQANVEPVIEVIFAPVNAFVDFLNACLAWAGAVTVGMLALGQSAAGSAGGLAQRVGNIAVEVVAQLSRIVALEGGFGHLVDTVRSLITDGIPTAIGAAVASLTALFHAGITAEETARKVALVALGQLVAQMVAQAEALAVQGEAALAHELSHTASALAQAIIDAEAVGKGYTDQVAHQLGLEITDLKNVVIPAAVGIAIADITTIATQIDTLQRECINPTCSALGAGLDLFSLLQQGLELLLIVELVAGIIHDPEKAAHDLVTGVSDLVGLASGVLDAFGIRV